MRDPDQKQGLRPKWSVTRVDDRAGKHSGCPTFVLDPVHDVFARAALAAYADACRPTYPLLAADLWKLLHDTSDAHRAALQANAPAEATPAERAA